jgi:phosphonate transport system substrate-binding protein
MVKCFYDYRFPADMQKSFDGADRFFPAEFKRDWEVVRKVAEGSGEAFNRAAYDKESAREADAAKKKAAEGKKP